MNFLKPSLFLHRTLQLAFVFLMACGFTCQKKYPTPAPQSETDESEVSSEGSNSPSETTDSSEGETQKPADKTDQ